MKRYRHKRLDKIATGYKQSNGRTTYATKNNEEYGIAAWLIEGSSDWEEIVEKEYKITGWIPKDEIYNTISSFKWNQDYEIYSVKRLSDGVEFKLQDKIQTGIIDNFTFCSEGNNIMWCNLKTGAAINIMFATLVKQPLFTTFDSVEIFEGDKYWTLRTEDKDWLFEDTSRGNINYFYGSDKDYSSKTGIYYFSTKEKAIDYIVENKPILSIKDIIDLFNRSFRNLDYKYIKSYLEELVKSKLNL